MIECDKCGGTGLVVVKAQDRVCKACAGVGKIVSDQPVAVEEFAPEEEVILDEPGDADESDEDGGFFSRLIK